MLLSAQADDELYSLHQGLGDADWVVVASWISIFSGLLAVARLEGVTRRIRGLLFSAAAIQALAAISDSGDGGSFGVVIADPTIMAWLTETLDVIYAATFALALAGTAGLLVLGRIVGDVAPALLSPESGPTWTTPEFQACKVTRAMERTELDWSFVDSAYCISLKEREDRAVAATAQFNEVGLASRLLFYRPNRHKTNPVLGIWESHCAVARHALAQGHERVAIFEDDVRFDLKLTTRKLGSIARALDILPDNWQIFFLGHWIIDCAFVSRTVLWTQSGCAHAYIASRQLLEWMAASDFEDFRRRHPEPSVIGRGIDDAFYRLPHAFAIFPMIAIQSTSPSDHLTRSKRGNIGRMRHIVTRTRFREWGISKLMRVNELRAVIRAAMRPRRRPR